MIHSAHFKGQCAQLKIEHAANEKGFLCSKPTIAARYDVLLDKDGKLFKVQIKYCGKEIKNDKVKFKFGGTRTDGSKMEKYSKEEIDFILIYVEKRDIIVKLNSKDFHNRAQITINVTDKKYIW